MVLEGGGVININKIQTVNTYSHSKRQVLGCGMDFKIQGKPARDAWSASAACLGDSGCVCRVSLRQRGKS